MTIGEIESGLWQQTRATTECFANKSWHKYKMSFFIFFEAKHLPFAEIPGPLSVQMQLLCCKICAAKLHNHSNRG